MPESNSRAPLRLESCPRRLTKSPRPVEAIACVALLLLCPLACQKPAPSGNTVTINGHSWNVELAMTNAERAQGLSGRQGLGERNGMLFVYPSPHVLQFWMKDCYFPLDIAFIGADRKIVAIETMACEPDRAGRTIYSSRVPAQWALEIGAGQFSRLGIKAGDRVEFSGGIPSAAKAQDGP